MKERFKEKYMELNAKTGMPYLSAIMALSEASEEAYLEASGSGDKMGTAKALLGTLFCGFVEGVAVGSTILYVGRLIRSSMKK